MFPRVRCRRCQAKYGLRGVRVVEVGHPGPVDIQLDTLESHSSIHSACQSTRLRRVVPMGEPLDSSLSGTRRLSLMSDGVPVAPLIRQRGLGTPIDTSRTAVENILAPCPTKLPILATKRGSPNNIALRSSQLHWLIQPARSCMSEVGMGGFSSHGESRTSMYLELLWGFH